MPAKKGRWWLTEDSHQIAVNAAPEQLYDLVADLPRMGEWSPECTSVEWTNGSCGPVEGATFVGHNRGGPGKLMRWSRHGRVLVAERGREFRFVTEEGGRESTEWCYRFEAVESGTRVSESYQVRWIPAWARILDVPTNRHRELKDAMRHTLEQLKARAEVAAGSSSRP